MQTLKRVLVDGGYYEPSSGKYIFFLTDDLGNNRVVADQAGTVIQKNHYYPFGMTFAENTELEQEKQPYKYNGKELDQMHGLNLYDYSARYYEPAIGRFTTMDPLAEKRYWLSPYQYARNNPIRYIDPDGKLDRDKNGKIIFYSEGKTRSQKSTDKSGLEYTVTYEVGYLKTDKGNKIEAEKLRGITYKGHKVEVIPEMDLKSNCHGLALADGEFVVLDPETILQDEYTEVDRSQGDDSSSKKMHDVVGVGPDWAVDMDGGLYHTAKTSDGGKTYSQQDFPGKRKDNQTLKQVVNYKGEGKKASGEETKDFVIIYYKKDKDEK